MGERRAQSRREKRLNTFLFKILASLRLCVFARETSLNDFGRMEWGDAGNFVNLFRPLIHIPKEEITPKRKRGFCLTAGCWCLVVAMENGPDGFVGPVNLGNPGELSILELAEMTIKMTGSRSKIIFEELPQDDPLQRQPDITLAKERLGWEPGVGFEEGLGRTIAYFRGL